MTNGARPDVLVVVPPFAYAGAPAFGASLLVAGCRGRGIASRALYGPLRFAARVGLGVYNRAVSSLDDDFLGERLFSPFAFSDGPAPGDRGPDVAALLTARAARRAAGAPLELRTGVEEGLSDAVTRVAEEVAPFLESFVAEILALRPRIVGFSSQFQQSLASVALARRLKAARPEVTTVLGGANASSPMGEALAELTGVFDFVFDGEADDAFPELCLALLERNERPAARLVRCRPLEDLDRAAVPDYDDFFEQLAEVTAADPLPEDEPLWLHLETARGCWWGEKRTCAFCGLNGRETHHRHKSAARVLAELRHLSGRYGTRCFQFTDNVLPRNLMGDLLPALGEEATDRRLFWEVRPNLSGSELDLLWRAGARELQPGIESLADNVLARMNKGLTGAGNLVFLRDCASRGIATRWNLLVRVPGETRADYEAMIRLFPLVEHLQPPEQCGPVRVDRFSPYHERPHAFGLGRLEPLPVYAQLYPPGAPLEDLAGVFLADYSTELYADRDLMRRFGEALWGWVGAWRTDQRRPKLTAVPLTPELLLVEDTRSCAAERYSVLTEGPAHLLERLERPVAATGLTAAERGTLAALLDRGYVVEHEGRLVSVVTRPAFALRLRRTLAPSPSGRRDGEPHPAEDALKADVTV